MTAAEIRPGLRVRLASAPSGAVLRGQTGVVRCKTHWADYWIIALDKPALYHDGSELPEIVEMADNLEAEGA